MFPVPPTVPQPRELTLEERVERDRLRLILTDSVPTQMEDLGVQGTIGPDCDQGKRCNHDLVSGVLVEDLMGLEDGPHPKPATKKLYVPGLGQL